MLPFSEGLFCARHTGTCFDMCYFADFTWPSEGSHFNPILQMRKLRLWNVKWLAQGHTASQGKTGNSRLYDSDPSPGHQGDEVDKTQALPSGFPSLAGLPPVNAGFVQGPEVGCGGLSCLLSLLSLWKLSHLPLPAWENSIRTWSFSLRITILVSDLLQPSDLVRDLPPLCLHREATFQSVSFGVRHTCSNLSEHWSLPCGSGKSCHSDFSVL